MTIYFQNKEPIDLTALTTMGVSVKTNDNPIGYFGTGLKYAIATLLRTGHKVRLYRKGETFNFTVQPKNIRGTEFYIVYMNGRGLGFTTELGKNWAMWQVFRELHSNALDEGGSTVNQNPDQVNGTIFAISGDGIKRAYKERASIFLETSAVVTHLGMELHEGANKYGFYRKTRALLLAYPSLYTYNLVARTELTEDRTIKSGWSFVNDVEWLIPQITDEDILEQILFAPEGVFEHSVTVKSGTSSPSAAFMEVTKCNRHNQRFNQSAIELWKRHSNNTTIFESITLTEFEQKQLDEALALLRILDCPLIPDEFITVESLGADIYGVMRKGSIIIARGTFDLGPRFLASTLYEEWLHKTRNLPDTSRAMQNALFEKLLTLAERLKFEQES